MKKKIILFIALLSFVLPMTVFASDFSSSLSGSNSINQNDTFNVTLKVSNTTNLMTFDTSLSYDKSKLELVSYSGESGFTVSVSSAIAGYGSPKSGSYSLITLKFKALSAFAPGQSTKISVGTITAADDLANEMTGSGSSLTVNVEVPKSSNNNLSTLEINGSAVSGFSASKTSYQLSNTDSTSISISAKAEDSKATVSGTGNKNLNYGENRFEISVTAENGSVKKYYVTVVRNDNRSKNNNLSSLSISPASIDFSKSKTSYMVIVENNVTSINISAKAEDSKSTVKGTGNKNLNVYSNNFNIVVTAENGSTKTYSINVVRKDENGNKGSLSTNNYLESLSIEGYEIAFDKDTDNYSIIVSNEVDSVKVNAEVSDDKSMIDIKNEKLKVGENVITITVTSESGDARVYKINVTRKNDAPSTTLDKLEDVLKTTESSMIEININDDNNEINSELIKILKEKNITLKINKYDGDKLLYSWEINSKDLSNFKTFDTLVKFSVENKENIDKVTNYSEAIYLEYLQKQTLPKNTKFKVYVGDKYEDDNKLNLYLYKDNKLKAKKQGLVVKNGYVEYEINEGGEYILTQASFNKSINIFLITTIIEFIGIVVLVYFVLIMNKKKK